MGKVALFLWLADEVIRRNPQGNKPVIFLSDGERGCMIVRASIYRKTRSASWICFMSWNGCGRWLGVSLTSEPRRQAHQWVEERLRRLLEGKVDAVIRGMRYQATQGGLKGQERKTVRGAAEYFERNRDRMKYDEYLAAGYPIGSGVVEGACRHLVKDRMERTGMRGCRPEHKRCWTYEPPTSMASGMPSGTST